MCLYSVCITMTLHPLSPHRSSTCHTLCIESGYEPSTRNCSPPNVLNSCRVFVMICRGTGRIRTLCMDPPLRPHPPLPPHYLRRTVRLLISPSRPLSVSTHPHTHTHTTHTHTHNRYVCIQWQDSVYQGVSDSDPGTPPSPSLQYLELHSGKLPSRGRNSPAQHSLYGRGGPGQRRGIYRRTDQEL